MTALRLLKPGNVYSSSLHRMSERPGQLPVTMHGVVPLVNRRVADRTYILSESDLPCLAQILEGLDSENPDRVPLAINRVNSAAERERTEDQLIDLMIALEALYGDGPPEAIGYKIRLRAATFLCNTPEDRWEMFTFLKEAYDKRSKVVHGDKHSAQKAVSTDLVDRLLECVQHTIRRRLADPRKFEAKDWDKLVLTGRTTTPA